jgi:alpha/beta superfamily hydrolase
LNAATRTFTIPGPVGRIDVALDLPTEPATAVAVVGHPHPLMGGTRDNKVAQTIARALVSLGMACWRPNFRGVGETDGVHDEGNGETEDMLAVVDYALAHESAPPAAPLILAGFSFGTFVQSRVAARLAEQGRPATRLLLVGTATSRFDVAPVPPGTIVIHGEQDEVVPLGTVFDWARPQDLPVIVMPGAEHFFHRKLTVLKQLVMDQLRAQA